MPPIYWTAQPTLFTLRDLDGHRVRFIVAEKAAPVETKILSFLNDAPDTLQAVNPWNRYPILADKHLLCAGSALDELLNERYPHPPLLSPLPVQRAQQRAIAFEIQCWYHLTKEQDIVDKLREVAELLDPRQAFLFNNDLSIVDTAIAPFLWKHKAYIADKKLSQYAQRLFDRESFQLSLTAQAAASFLVVVEQETWIQGMG